MPSGPCYPLRMDRSTHHRSSDAAELHSLLERLARVVASEDWAGGLNPAQAAALAYLARANRFSRKPSIVSGYLGATRGTVSQTLKTLVRKGLVQEAADPKDGRSISYGVTQDGYEMLERRTALERVLAHMEPEEVAGLDASLRNVLLRLLDAHSQKTFGVCRTCWHHEVGATGRHCRLLNVALSPVEADQICVEHTQKPDG